MENKTKYVELGYQIYEGMELYPGLPETKVAASNSIEHGDGWNGSYLSIYLHAGTHVDAPYHYLGEGACGIDEIPIENFFYSTPVMIELNFTEKDKLITMEDIIEQMEELQEADLIIFNTNYYKLRCKDFMEYATGFPTLSEEVACFIKKQLPKVKAVAIDTLSIENLTIGAGNGYAVHKTLLDPTIGNRSVCIYEDINPAPLNGKDLVSACCTPLRIRKGDASICNLVVEVIENDLSSIE